MRSGWRAEEECQGFRKPFGPFLFTVSRAFVDSHQQSVFAQPGATQNPFQFANIIDHLSIAIFTSGFPGSNRHEYSGWPLAESATRFQELPIGNEKRRTLQQ